MLTPAAEDRIAVLLMRELPGRESRRDWAFDLGSDVGVGVVLLKRTLEAASAGVRRGSREMVGRRRAAPAGGAGLVDALGGDVIFSWWGGDGLPERDLASLIDILKRGGGRVRAIAGAEGRFDVFDRVWMGDGVFRMMKRRRELSPPGWV